MNTLHKELLSDIRAEHIHPKHVRYSQTGADGHVVVEVDESINQGSDTVTSQISADSNLSSLTHSHIRVKKQHIVPVERGWGARKIMQLSFCFFHAGISGAQIAAYVEFLIFLFFADDTDFSPGVLTLTIVAAILCAVVYAGVLLWDVTSWMSFTCYLQFSGNVQLHSFCIFLFAICRPFVVGELIDVHLSEVRSYASKHFIRVLAMFFGIDVPGLGLSSLLLGTLQTDIDVSKVSFLAVISAISVGFHFVMVMYGWCYGADKLLRCVFLLKWTFPSYRGSLPFARVSGQPEKLDEVVVDKPVWVPRKFGKIKKEKRKYKLSQNTV